MFSPLVSWFLVFKGLLSGVPVVFYCSLQDPRTINGIFFFFFFLRKKQLPDWKPYEGVIDLLKFNTQAPSPSPNGWEVCISRSLGKS